MKKNYHPNKKKVRINCNCGNDFNLLLSINNDILNVEVCNKCHPFYTGKHKIIDTSGRVDSFYKKFGKIEK
jgi:large subunit ribosomal protein L31